MSYGEALKAADECLQQISASLSEEDRLRFRHDVKEYVELSEKTQMAGECAIWELTSIKSVADLDALIVWARKAGYAETAVHIDRQISMYARIMRHLDGDPRASEELAANGPIMGPIAKRLIEEEPRLGALTSPGEQVAFMDRVDRLFDEELIARARAESSRRVK